MDSPSVRPWPSPRMSARWRSTWTWARARRSARCSARTAATSTSARTRTTGADPPGPPRPGQLRGGGSGLAHAHAAHLVVRALREDEPGPRARGRDVLRQVGAVDFRPHGQGPGDGLLLGEIGEAPEEGALVAERRLPQVEEAVHVPTADVLLVRVHVDGEVEEVRQEGVRHLPPLQRPRLEHVEPLEDEDVGPADGHELTRDHVIV